MRDILQQLVRSLEARRPVVYCRLVETRGSTPQKAGAAMLVYPDGTQAGTLGGGCVEAEVKRSALRTLEAGQPGQPGQSGRSAIVSFTLDSDYGWDDGLICGGRMQVLIDPVRDSASADYFRRFESMLSQGAGCCEAVAFDTKSGLAVPSSFLFDDQRELVASVGWAPPTTAAAGWAPPTTASEGRSPPAAALGNDRKMVGSVHPTVPEIVLQNLPSLSDRPRPTASHGIAYLPVLRRCRLLIVGGGHVGLAVASLAADLDFDVWVVDDREDFVSAERFPRAQRRICGPIGPTLRDLEITPDTYCLIVTRGHNHDEEALFHLVNRGARYVGMIGSKRKIKLIFDDLLSEGVSPEALSQVYAPLGIDIGSQTVPEIAVSICAELVAHRNLGGRVPGRPEAVEAPGGTGG
jgi:xanthine dehydrogenase accessory factor